MFRKRTEEKVICVGCRFHRNMDGGKHMCSAKTVVANFVTGEKIGWESCFDKNIEGECQDFRKRCADGAF